MPDTILKANAHRCWEQSTVAHRSFQILSFENSLLILFLMKKYDFNSSVYETLATTNENCLYYSLFFPSSQNL